LILLLKKWIKHSSLFWYSVSDEEKWFCYMI
jgi:hypothetical protein